MTPRKPAVSIQSAMPMSGMSKNKMVRRAIRNPLWAGVHPQRRRRGGVK